MSLCRLHHAAFDRLLLGVQPDYIIRVRADVLEEVDGPMLRHGLQGLQGQRIVVPSRRVDRPDEGRLGGEVGAVFGGGVNWDVVGSVGFFGLQRVGLTQWRKASTS